MCLLCLYKVHPLNHWNHVIKLPPDFITLTLENILYYYICRWTVDNITMNLKIWRKILTHSPLITYIQYSVHWKNIISKIIPIFCQSCWRNTCLNLSPFWFEITFLFCNLALFIVACESPLKPTVLFQFSIKSVEFCRLQFHLVVFILVYPVIYEWIWKL